MVKTQRFIIACLVLASGLGTGYVLALLLVVTPKTPHLSLEMTDMLSPKTEALYVAIKEEFATNGVPIDGLSPYVLLEHFPAVMDSDFSGAEAVIGRYEVKDGVLTHESVVPIEDSVAGDLSKEGFAQFLLNYSIRTGHDILSMSPNDALLHLKKSTGNDMSKTATSSDSFTACTMDAKQCPDGSFVGRIAPTCEFATCPNATTTQKTVSCTREQKESDMCLEIYQPVCATVQIQCLSSPCEPIPKTFGNSCEACQEPSVTEYTEGACVTPLE